MTARCSSGRGTAMLALIGCVLASMVAVVGCSVSGTAVGEKSSVVQSQTTVAPPIRQIDDFGRRLPFTTKFPNRWSRNNDGTTYEPCTTLSLAALQSLHLDPATAKDAAVADGQTGSSGFRVHAVVLRVGRSG